MTFLALWRRIYLRRPLLHNRAGQKCLNGRESFVKARKKWLLPIKLDGASFSPQECRQLYVGKKLTLRLGGGAVKGEIDCRRCPQHRLIRKIISLKTSQSKQLSRRWQSIFTGREAGDPIFPPGGCWTSGLWRYKSGHPVWPAINPIFVFTLHHCRF